MCAGNGVQQSALQRVHDIRGMATWRSAPYWLMQLRASRISTHRSRKYGFEVMCMVTNVHQHLPVNSTLKLWLLR